MEELSWGKGRAGMEGNQTHQDDEQVEGIVVNCRDDFGVHVRDIGTKVT